MKTKLETLELVENSPSSIFSKEDVITLIKGITEGSQVSDLKDQLLDELRGEEYRLIDKDNATFSIMSENQIYIDSVELNWDIVEHCIDNILNQ